MMTLCNWRVSTYDQMPDSSTNSTTGRDQSLPIDALLFKNAEMSVYELVYFQRVWNRVVR